jgi:hypothetical protein
MNRRIEEDQEEEEIMLFGEVIAIVTKQVDIIQGLLNERQAPRIIQVLTTSINNQTFIFMNPLSLQVGFKAPIIEQLADVTDPANPKVIAGATMVPKSKVSDNVAAATVDASGNLVGVAPGNGNLIDINTWTYIDPKTGQSVTADFQTIAPFVISEPAAASVSQLVSLGVAVPVIPVAAAAVHTGPAR